MSVAARRIFGDAERRTEHPGLGGELLRPRCTIDRKDEKTVRSELLAERYQGFSIGRQEIQRARIGDRHEQPAAAFARDAGGHDLVQGRRRELERFGDPQGRLERQRVVQFGHRLAKLDDGIVPRVAAHADFDHAGAAGLAQRRRAAPPEGEQHGVRRDGRVPDERCLLARIEETQPDVVIRRVGGAHESGFGVGKLARDGGHRRIALAVGIEDDGRRVATEALLRERIHLKNLHAILPLAPPRQWRSFARIAMASYTHSNLGVALWGPEMRDTGAAESCEPVEPDPVSTGVGSRCHAKRS